MRETTQFMKFLIETALFLVILVQITLLSGRMQDQAFDNRRLSHQVAMYEQSDYLFQNAKTQADLLIALR